MTENQNSCLELSHNEAFYLCTVVFFRDTVCEDALAQFKLRLGSVLVEEKGGTVAIDESEAKLLSDKINIMAVMGTEKVGYQLHKKIFKILLTKIQQEEVQRMGLHVCEENEDTNTREKHKQLREFLKGYDGNATSTDQNTNPNTG